MRPFAAALAGLLAGCLQPGDLQHCGTTVCPDELVCIDGTRCVDPGSISVCDGATADAACDAGGVPGRCVSHVGPDAQQVAVCDPASCGDDVIDEALHEQCDGAASFRTQCVDLGFDLGLPVCTATCEFDTSPEESTCERFGWDPIIDAGVYAMWTDGQIIAYASYPSTLRVTGGGFDVIEQGRSYKLVTGGGGRVVAAEMPGIPKEVTATSVVDLGWKSAVNGTVAAIAMDPQGTIYAISECALAPQPTKLWKNTGGTTWTQVNTDAISCSQLQSNRFHIAVTAGGRLFLSSDSTQTIYEVLPNGTLMSKWTLGQSPLGNVGIPVEQLAAHVDAAGEALWVATANNLARIPLTGSAGPSTLSPARGITSMAFASTSVFGADSKTGIGVRWDGTTVDELALPAGTITDDGAGNVLAYGGPVYRYRGKVFGELPPPALELDDPVVGAIPDGELFASAFHLLTPPDPKDVSCPSSWCIKPSPYGAGVPIVALGGVSVSKYVVSARSGTAAAIDETPQFCYFGLPGQSYCMEIEPATNPPHIDGAWMDPTDYSVYAAGYAPNKPDDYPGFIGTYSATTRTWSSLPGQPALDNCSVHGVSGDATTILFVGECAGMAQLWSYARGTMTWTTNAFPVILGPLFSVQKIGGELYAIGDFGAAWTRGGAWQTDATITGRSISGTSASDVWVAGVFTQIQHWDGTAWSKMTTRLLGPAVVHATANRVLFPGAAANHVSLLREP